MDNLILITNWECVEKDDFYLTDDWDEYKELSKEDKKQLKNRKLYYGYIADATNYAIYYQLDAQQVIIDEDADIIIYCEGVVISNDHKHREKLDY